MNFFKDEFVKEFPCKWVNWITQRFYKFFCKFSKEDANGIAALLLFVFMPLWTIIGSIIISLKAKEGEMVVSFIYIIVFIVVFGLNLLAWMAAVGVASRKEGEE